LPQQPHRDHGVTGTTHWLLDEELASIGSRRRTEAPAALRHEAVEAPVPTTTATIAEPPKHNFLVLVAGLVTALLVYALLSSADIVGALEEVYPGEGADSIRIDATVEEPGARELELRALLAATPGATIERPAPSAPSSSGKPKAPSGSNPGPDDGVTPPPPPPPIIPEIPLPGVEVPGVEVPPLPELEAPRLEVPELPVPDLAELP
jgi:hypothetical protein